MNRLRKSAEDIDPISETYWLRDLKDVAANITDRQRRCAVQLKAANA
jgi:hypothetical protein